MIFWFPYTYKVCVSTYTKTCVQRLYKTPGKQLSVIHNGIDTSLRDLAQRNSSRIERFRQTHHIHTARVGLYYGHSGASKGLDYFVHAIPHIIKKYPDFKAIINLIPGKRDYLIYKLVKKLGIQEHVLFLHGVQKQELVNLVLLADMVIVPSISDGFGLVAAEVSQLEKPLIVTRNGALPEVVSGKVVFLRDLRIESFVEAIDKVAHKKWHIIAPKSFSRDETVKKYEALYQRASLNTP